MASPRAPAHVLPACAAALSKDRRFNACHESATSLEEASFVVPSLSSSLVARPSVKRAAVDQAANAVDVDVVVVVVVVVLAGAA